MSAAADLLAAAGLVAVVAVFYILPAWLWVERHRLAKTLRWHRDGWSWSVAWVRATPNVHDGEDWSHLGTGVRRWRVGR